MASARPAIRGARNGSPASDAETDPAGTDPILAEERVHLRRSREYLRLMREDVLSLRALGGDPVSEEYLKADLYRRAEALHDLPDTPLFFGRLDYADNSAAASQDGGPTGPGPATESRSALGSGPAAGPGPGLGPVPAVRILVIPRPLPVSNFMSAGGTCMTLTAARS